MKNKHHTRRGYRNNYAHERRNLGDFFRFLWGFRRKAFHGMNFPLAHNDPKMLALNRERSTLTWIGHSTFLVQLDGLNILTDPHFTGRASPLRWAGPERFVQPGIAMKDLPPIDVVLISHNHYDHLDEGSVKWLIRHHPKAVFFVPLGLRRWLQRRHAHNIVELDWWQEHEAHGFKVAAVPAQHFSGRTATDRNKTLWCGFILESAGKRLYFAGDTGYSKDFADIGERYAPLDLALLPIGAYEPRWFMKPMHVNPEEAVRIHCDIGSRQSVAMHWGTFRLTEEELDEPPKHLGHALAEARIPAEKFWVMRHGETRKLSL